MSVNPAMPYRSDLLYPRCAEIRTPVMDRAKPAANSKADIKAMPTLYQLSLNNLYGSFKYESTQKRVEERKYPTLEMNPIILVIWIGSLTFVVSAGLLFI